MRLFYFFLVTSAIGVLTLLSRCGGTPSPNSTGNSPSFASIYTNSLQQCNSCHSPGHAVYDVSKVLLDLSTVANAYASLTTKSSSSPSAASCAGISYAKAKDPANSYLTIVLVKSYNVTGAGGKAACVPYNVHLSANLLQQSELDNITAWINAGTLNN